MTTIAYLVHDLNDAAVARRVRMFVASGARVRLAGFHRRAAADQVAGVPATDLGVTHDARLTARVVAVMRHVARPAAARSIVAGADVVVARNLEMLAIAVRASRPGQRIVYECLDIHRLLLTRGPAGRLLRGLERRLLRRTAMIVTSSPAFQARYFVARQRYRLPVRLEENRVLALGEAASSTAPERIVPVGGPLRIGWFGMLRCYRSLAMLRQLVTDRPGEVEVVLAGVPARTEFDDFDRDVSNLTGLAYVGPYNAADLPRLYGSIDLAWAIDYFEDGLNSSWLLPNRLYESLAHGAVPVALAGVETGRWLDGHAVGVTVDDPVPALAALADRPTRDWLDALTAAADALPRPLLVADDAACRTLVAAISGKDVA